MVPERLQESVGSPGGQKLHGQITDVHHVCAVTCTVAAAAAVRRTITTHFSFYTVWVNMGAPTGRGRQVRRLI